MSDRIDEKSADLKEKNKDELLILTLFNNFKFDKIGENITIKEEDKLIGEIDLIYKFENNLFLIEVKNKKEFDKDEIDHWFSKWSYEKNLNKLFEDLNISKSIEVFRIFFDMHRQSSEKEKLRSIEHCFDNKNNHYFFKDDAEYFIENSNEIGVYSRYDFLNLININRKNIYEDYDAIKFKINGKIVYSFVAKVKDLLEVCYVMRKFNEETGYQRSLNYKRIKEISDNINNQKIIAFPNSIIVHSEEKLNLDNIKLPNSVKIRMPKYYCKLRVIDGQHRLLGFSKVKESILNDSYLPVIAFEDLTNLEELKLFVDINSKQKKVDSNLVYLLKCNYSWNSDQKEYYEKIAVKIILQLNDHGPLANKIYTGMVKEKNKGRLSLSTLVTILINNGFIKKKNSLWQNEYNDEMNPEIKMKEIINTINSELYDFKINDELFFFQNMGLRMIFRLIRIMENNRNVYKISVKNIDIIKDIKNTLTKEDLNNLQKSYGEGGAINSSTYICKKLIQIYPNKYKNMEIDLKKIPFIKHNIGEK
jgi:DGQHR domain-containing protein